MKDRQVMMAWTFTRSLIDHALAELGERVERMDEGRFLREHEAAHSEPRSPAIDLVASVLEAEWIKRYPRGRDDEGDA